MTPADRQQDAGITYERDSVTGCYTMYGFLGCVENMRLQKKEPGADSIIYFNIPEFKLFNDTFGIERGNRCLRRIADILREVFGTTCIARFYADEFFVYYEGKDVIEKVSLCHDRVQVLMTDFKLILTAGIAYLEGTESVSSFCDYAKMACDEVRHNGKKYYNIYTREMRDALYRKKYLQDNIDRAIKEGYIEVYYQPVIRALTGKLCGTEALARWNDPVYGMLSPAVFVPALEERYLSYKLDTHIVERVCRDLHERVRAGLPVVPVSVNFSRKDFAQCDTVTVVENAVRKYNLERRLLNIEITESAMMENPQKIHDLICRFHKAGYQVWMDDFGSGYSTLNMLDQFHFDELKLDMVFMRDFNERAKVVVRHVISMSRDLGIHTLEEGVETQEQVDFLRNAGCEKLQGFYYSRPLPAQHLLSVLEQKKIVFEDRDEEEAFEKISRDVFRENEKFLLTYYDGKDFKLIFVNEDFRKYFRDMGFDGRQETIEKILNNRTAASGVRLHSKVEKAMQNNGTLDFYTVFARRNFRMQIRKLADVGNRSILRIACEDISGERMHKCYHSFLDSISDVYHTVYRLDYDTGQTEVVTSEIPEENAGDIIDSIPNPELLRRIHPQDRERFLYCSKQEYVSGKMDGTGHGHYSDPFRVKTENGYVWTEFMVVRVFTGGKLEYLCCLKPALLPDHLQAEADRAASSDAAGGPED